MFGDMLVSTLPLFLQKNTDGINVAIASIGAKRFYLQVNTRLQKVQYCRGVEVGVDLGTPEDVVYEALEAGP